MYEEIYFQPKLCLNQLEV